MTDTLGPIFDRFALTVVADFTALVPEGWPPEAAEIRLTQDTWRAIDRWDLVDAPTRDRAFKVVQAALMAEVRKLGHHPVGSTSASS